MIVNHVNIRVNHITGVTEASYTGFDGATRKIDDYGNVEWAQVTKTGHGQTHTKTVTSTYHPPDTANWIVGSLKDAAVVHHFSGPSADPTNTDVTRSSSFTYYPNGQLQTETIEPNATDLTLKKITSYQYDQYGEVSNITKAGWNTQGVQLTRSVDIGRVSELFNGHPAIKQTTTNSLNESESVWVSQLHGGQIGHRGPNGKESRAEYDALGRKFSETSSLDVTTLTSYDWTFEEPLNSLYSVTQNTQGVSDYSTTYFDTLNREIQVKTKSLDGRDVINQTVYNDRGLKEKINRPYLAYTDPVWICYSYDALGRVEQIDGPAAMGGSPNCDGSNRAYATTSYDQLTITSTDELGHVKKETQNLLGQVARIDEAYGTIDHSWLDYKYDATGNLKTVTDATNKVTGLDYDNNGRKQSIDDPAMGQWSYEYNSFDELTKQTDAKLQEISLQYDSLGRMSQRTDGEGLWQWHYAGLNDPHLIPVGKLKSITGPNGYQQAFTYTNKLQLRTTTESQTLPGGIAESNTQTVTYDELGRVDTQYFPNAFETTNEYNQYGHLVAVKSPAMTISAEAQAKLEARKVEAEQKAAEAEALATTYLNQAYSYQQQAIQYETLAIGLLRKEGYTVWEETNAFMYMFKDLIWSMWGVNIVSGSNQLYQAANELRDISIELINRAEAKRGEALGHLQLVAGDPTGTHRYDAQRSAQQAIDKLAKAKTIVTRLKTGAEGYNGANGMLGLAEQQITGAQSAYGNFQNQTFLAERYATHAAGIETDLADTASTTWWRASAADAEGRVTEAVYGNGTSTERDYDPNNGQLLRIHTTDGVQTLQDLNYSYDNLDNVKSREDSKLNYIESYNYDALDRLKHATLEVTGLGTAARDWTYDKVGNLEAIDSNSFSYDETDKLTAIPAQAKTYSYDANGNQETNAGRTIDWSSFNKPTLLTKGTQQTEFTYDADHNRMLKINKESLMVTKTTVYFGGYEKIIESSGDIEHRYHVSVGSSVVAIRSVKTDAAGIPTAAASSNYLHKDALGSVDLITDDKGVEVIRLAYTPFGKRRNIDALQGMTSYASLTLLNFTPLLTRRGYTGQEHIDELDLIHMNGRVYDPATSRFLSPDPFVQYYDNSQSYNRYAYVRNNPLKYTDPSGFFDLGVNSDYDFSSGFQIDWDNIFTSGFDGGFNQSFNLSIVSYGGTGDVFGGLSFGDGIGTVFSLNALSLPFGPHYGPAEEGLQTGMFGGLEDSIDGGLSYLSFKAVSSNSEAWVYAFYGVAVVGSVADFVFGGPVNKVDDIVDGIKGGVANSIARLPDDLAGTFAGGRYTSRLLDKDITLYRAGTADRPLGQFFSKDIPISGIQTRIDKAILPVWPGGAKAPIDTFFKVRIPAGTTIHTGRIGSQGGPFVGGTQQIVVEQPWLLEGVKVLGSSPLK